MSTLNEKYDKECDNVYKQIYDLEEAGIKGEFEKKMYNNFKEKKKRLYAEKEELNKVYKLKKEKFCKENWLPK